MAVGLSIVQSGYYHLYATLYTEPLSDHPHLYLFRQKSGECYLNQFTHL